MPTDFFIDGRLMTPDATDRLAVINPATEEVIGEIASATSAEIERAVAAARSALGRASWAGTTGVERAEYLRSLADALERRGQRIASAVTSQNGMPLHMSLWGNDVLPVETYRYFAEVAEAFEPEALRVSRDGTSTLVRREPVGVAGLIVPWNGPHALLSWKLGAALAAGCTAVIKSAPETSLDLVEFAEAVQESGIPHGVINFVMGGADVGQAIVAHPGINKVAFTGSTAAGRHIAQVCGAALKPATLELGGKSAALFLDDGDVDLLVANIAVACIPNSGQACYSSTRILAPRSRYDEVLAAVENAASSIRVGDPLETTSDAGPLVTARQLDRVLGYIESGKQEGARLVTGGGRPTGMSRGYYVEPTVFADVDSRMRIAQEEIFGPVLAVIPFDDDADAVRIANDSEYGLGGMVFTIDSDRGMNIARQVQTGTIGINRYAVPLDAPFGGYKASGLGRELGPEGLDAYLETKAIYC